MNNENKLVPKLRFPEFKTGCEWVFEDFSNYIKLYRGSSPRPIQNYFTTEANGVNWIKIGDASNAVNFLIKKVEEKITPEGAKKSRRVDVGELVLANSMSFGKTYVLAIEGCIYDGWFVLREYEANYDKQFLLQLLNSDYMQTQYKKLSAGGIVQNISSEIVYQTILPHTSLKEQQKIAACFSSLDEIITAESEKLEVLKEHKKGLLQNLFPQEGETVTKLRFKEFEDSGEWVGKLIDEIAKVSAGGTPESTNTEYWNGEIPWMNSGELNNKRIFAVSNFITAKGLSESSTKLIPPKCVLIGLAGQGKTRGTAAINYIELCTNQSIGSIHPNEKVFVSEFLYHKIDSMYDELRKLSAGDGGRGGLNLQLIKSIRVELPSLTEQQKIASCLSSLDDLINAQNQKIEVLKLHKKGLLQGLFPVVNDAME